MRQLRLVLLGLAAVLALLLGGTFFRRAIGGPPVDTAVIKAAPAEAPAASQTVAAPSAAVRAARGVIERSIGDTPDYTRFFDRLHLVFPNDYETIMNGIADRNLQNKDINVDGVMADAVGALRRMRGGLASRASNDALGQIFAIQRKEMRELEARDPHLCVAFLYGANGMGFLAFAADHRGLVADAAIASLEAMNSGRMDSVQRGAPSDDDFQALDKALVDKGLSRPEIEALLDGKTADPPIADETMCQAGQTYLDTLAVLPQDMRARLYGLAVDLMAKS
jgi:hypothetical protein